MIQVADTYVTFNIYRPNVMILCVRMFLNETFSRILASSLLTLKITETMLRKISTAKAIHQAFEKTFGDADATQKFH